MGQYTGTAKEEYKRDEWLIQWSATTPPPPYFVFFFFFLQKKKKEKKNY